MGLVRTWKQNKLAIGTYSLERANIRTGQDMERKKASKGHLLSREVRGQARSEYRKKVGQQGILTNWGQ